MTQPDKISSLSFVISTRATLADLDIRVTAGYCTTHKGPGSRRQAGIYPNHIKAYAA